MIICKFLTVAMFLWICLYYTHLQNVHCQQCPPPQTISCWGGSECLMDGGKIGSDSTANSIIQHIFSFKISNATTPPIYTLDSFWRKNQANNKWSELIQVRSVSHFLRTGPCSSHPHTTILVFPWTAAAHYSPSCFYVRVVPRSSPLF